MDNQPNFIDRAIEVVAPGWAAKRAIARTQLATHRGGVSTRVSTTWGRSQSFAGGRRIERLNQASRRDRARRVYDEHPIGQSLVDTEVDNVISSGFTLQAKSDSKEFNVEVEARYEEWWQNYADIRGMMCGTDLDRQFYRDCRVDGDGGMILVDKGGQSRVQLIPGDLICNPYYKVEPGILDGVEVDAFTKPVAFHVLSQDDEGKRNWERIPANNFVYRTPKILRTLDVRGDSCYSTIFGYLDQIDGYIDAVIIAARMAAIFGLIFKSETAGKQVLGLNTLQNSQGQQQKAVTVENGMARYIGEKDDVVQVQAQQPMQQTPDFIRAILRLLGLPFSMPLELVLKDLSQVNFSSARVGLLQYYRACRAKQKSFILGNKSRVYRWWLSREINRGRILAAIPANPLEHKFLSEGWSYTSPVDEAQADWMQMAMGTKTGGMICAEQGRDYEEICVELAAERAMKRILKLPDVELNTTRDRIEVVTATGAPPEDPIVVFKRQAWLGFQADGTVADVVANQTDLKQLTKDVGLPLNGEYIDPYLPVETASGAAVTGDVLKDPQGDIVGGVSVSQPPAAPANPQQPQPTPAAGPGAGGKPA